MVAETVIVVPSLNRVFCTMRHIILPVSLVKVSNWPSQSTLSIGKTKNKRPDKGKGTNNCHKRWMASLTFRISPNVIRLDLGSWIRWYLHPSTNSIFDSLFPKASVKQGVLCWEQSYSQPPCHYTGMNGKTHEVQHEKAGGYNKEERTRARLDFHSPSISFQCMHLLNFIYLLLIKFQTLSLFISC